MARLLFVTSRLPYPPREGHQLRSWHLLQAAAKQHQVDLLCLQRPEDPVEVDPVLRATVHSLKRVPVPSLRAPASLARMATRWLAHGQPLLSARYLSAPLRAEFRALAATADLVHLDILAVAGLLADVPVGVPVVLNEHNVEYQLLQAHASIETRRWRRPWLRWQARELERFERAACTAASRVLACSDIDAHKLVELAPEARVQVIANGVDLQRYAPRSPPNGDQRTLVFVGQMSWFPNHDGISDFMAHSLPLIRRQHPDVRLLVIGKDGGMRAPAGLESAVEFAGFVDDLRTRVLDAAVYVVPLRAGSGTRLKILEAMAMGKGIVSTRIGAEGIGLCDGVDALLADTPEDFAAAVCRLLDDRPLRMRLGAAARQRAEQHFGWEAIGTRLRAVYSDLLEARQASQR